jgi:hypothetical protein
MKNLQNKNLVHWLYVRFLQRGLYCCIWQECTCPVHFGTSKLLSDFLGGGGTCQTWVLCSFLAFHALKFSNYYLLIFQILGLIFPSVSNCIISAYHFHILLLYKESPQIIAFSLWCFCFMLVLWSHVWHIEIVSCSLLFLFFDIWYLLLWLGTFTPWNWQNYAFFYFVPPPFGKQLCVENINQIYLAKSSYELWFLFPENLANLFGV